MERKVLIVEGRQFRTESDYAQAKRDKELIDKIRGETDFGDREALERLRNDLRGGRYKFMTLLGRDFLDEVEELLKKSRADNPAAGTAGRRPDARHPGFPGQKKGMRAGSRNASLASGRQAPGQAGNSGGKKNRFGRQSSGRDTVVDERFVAEELRKREKRRKLTIFVCRLAAACCLGYFGIYSYYIYRTRSTYQKMSELKEKTAAAASQADTGPLYTLDGDPEDREVLDEYKNLLLQNKKLIGWVKIDDTNIDYPVMQTSDNEYYLDHNLNQEYDKNGTIFMDKDCDVLKPSTNYILYGHHMKSGQMFGQLDLYKKQSFYEEHPYIQFDTIYEKGTYQVMYVFRSRVYKETEIVFKYYQFIDANSEQEFDSNMAEMAEMSLYDTGVTAEYGDQLLTLSTCDYQETDGRFVVVAKKIAKE